MDIPKSCQLVEKPRIPSGLVVMTLAYQIEGRWFESMAQRMLLSQKGFEYVIMKPALPAKAVGPQPANVPLRNEVQGFGQATPIHSSMIVWYRRLA